MLSKIKFLLIFCKKYLVVRKKTYVGIVSCQNPQNDSPLSNRLFSIITQYSIARLYAVFVGAGHIIHVVILHRYDYSRIDRGGHPGTVIKTRHNTYTAPVRTMIARAVLYATVQCRRALFSSAR